MLFSQQRIISFRWQN